MANPFRILSSSKMEKYHEYRNDSIDCAHSFPRGRITHLASQQELGVLSKRRVRPRGSNLGHLASLGSNLMNGHDEPPAWGKHIAVKDRKDWDEEEL
jgi:hypothetical protein